MSVTIKPTAPATLFEVPFASAMSNSDIALLVRTLGLSARLHLETTSRHAISRDTISRHDSPGFARLDHSSGLFLKRGVIEGDWLLEARSWAHPASQRVHEWHVLAADAAHQLDPAVTFPERLRGRSPAVRNRHVGRARNKRFSRIRRRLVGLQ